MTQVSSAQKPIDALESLLVKRFRAAQTLIRWTRQEQTALMSGDIPRLLVLAEYKEKTLDRLAGYERVVAAQIGAMTGSDAHQIQPPPLDRLAEFDPAAAEPLMRLVEGTEVIAAQIRDLARANQALAQSALRRAAGQQAGWAFTAQASLPALCAAILDARQALDAQDHAGVEAAVDVLTDALLPLNSPEAPTRAFSAGHEGVPRTLPPVDQNLVEKMAGFYRQEKAYQAVLRTSSRVLTGV